MSFVVWVALIVVFWFVAGWFMGRGPNLRFGYGCFTVGLVLLGDGPAWFGPLGAPHQPDASARPARRLHARPSRTQRPHRRPPLISPLGASVPVPWETNPVHPAERSGVHMFLACKAWRSGLLQTHQPHPTSLPPLTKGDQRMTTELIFEELPSTAGRPAGSPFTEWLLVLQSHPGRWAKYPEPFAQSSGAASAKAERVNNGRFAQIEQGEYEAKTRTVDGQRWVYARCIGGE